jgi:hypothetical protein
MGLRSFVAPRTAPKLRLVWSEHLPAMVRAEFTEARRRRGTLTPDSAPKIEIARHPEGTTPSAPRRRRVVGVRP